MVEPRFAAVEKDLKVEPEAVVADVVEVEHVLRGGILGLSPEPGQARPDPERGTPVRADRVRVRTRTDDAELPRQHVPEPRQFPDQLRAHGKVEREGELLEAAAVTACHLASFQDR